MSVNGMDLLKDVVDIPHFDCSINRWRNHGIPISNGKAADFNDPPKMGVQIL